MGREERGTPGGTAALLAFIEEHRPALTWDFRRYLGRSLADIGGDIPWGEANHLIGELLRETGSHLCADVAGFSLAASQAEFATILHAEAFLNYHRDREVQKAPIELPAPFDRAPDMEPMTEEEHAAATAYLASHSAFRDD